MHRGRLVHDCRSGGKADDQRYTSIGQEARVGQDRARIDRSQPEHTRLLPPQPDNRTPTAVGDVEGLADLECVGVPQRQSWGPGTSDATSGVWPRPMPSTSASAPGGTLSR